MINLSIIIPVYNEVNNLAIFIKRLFNTFENENVEYIFINDGSIDGSAKILDNLCNSEINNNCKLINIKKNSGKGNAIHEGLKISSGELVLFQDADLELDTSDSLEMLKIISNDNSIDCIFGSRYLSGKLKKNNNYLNKFVVQFNSLLFNFLFKQSLSDLHCGTKIISKKILDSLNLTIKDFGFEIDIASQIAKKNYDIYEYGISYFARSKKEGKKITWIDGLKSYYYLFKTRFLQNDLATIISLIFSFSYMGYLGFDFESGIIKVFIILIFLIIGLFVGLNKKIINSLIILLTIYLINYLTFGGGNIYIFIISFLVGLFISNKISNFIKSNFQNKFTNFLF